MWTFAPRHEQKPFVRTKAKHEIICKLLGPEIVVKEISRYSVFLHLPFGSTTQNNLNDGMQTCELKYGFFHYSMTTFTRRFRCDRLPQLTLARH
jgi:hypothetical protein